MKGFKNLWMAMFCRHPKVTFVEKATGDHKNVAAECGGYYIHRCDRCGAAVYKDQRENG